MKKLLLLIVVLSLSINGFGQTTLTAANNNPMPGDIWYKHPCDSAHSEGSGGAGMTWDFSSLIISTGDTVSYYACSALYDCSRFPGSNLAGSNQSGSLQEYFYMDASKLSLMGVSLPSYPISDTFQDPMDAYHYPFTYTDSFTDSFIQHAINTSIGNAYQYGTVTSVCDGWGTLILPVSIGTFTNALRLHNTEILTDSSLGSSTMVTHYKTESYTWMVPGSRIVSFSIDYSNSLVPSVSRSVGLIEKMQGTGINKVLPVNDLVQLYPNPFYNETTIKIDAKEGINDASIVVTDITGRMVKKMSLTNAETTLNRGALSSGIYFYRVFNNGSQIANGKMNIQ